MAQKLYHIFVKFKASIKIIYSIYSGKYWLWLAIKKNWYHKLVGKFLSKTHASCTVWIIVRSLYIASKNTTKMFDKLTINNNSNNL